MLDLLFHLPIRYEDRTRITPIQQIHPGEFVLIQGEILNIEVLEKGRRMHVVRIQDGSGIASLRFFHFTPHQKSQFARGRHIQCYGEARLGYGGVEINHPDYEFPQHPEDADPGKALTPIYPTTEGLHQKTIRALIDQALGRLGEVEELLEGYTLPMQEPLGIREALIRLHRPSAVPMDASPHRIATERLAFEELLAHHLSLQRFRNRLRSLRAPRLTLPDPVRNDLLQNFGFTLTDAQKRVTAEILEDLEKPSPMMRLVQGDVGCGKTAVAALAVLAALASGYQAAIMAPTDLLAEQHAATFRSWLESLGITIGFLSSRLRQSEKNKVLEGLREGTTGLVIGTHALFQESIHFQRLGMIIIDEQHRFGVHQRLALRQKGLRENFAPHQLIMTATPIPRTLAMTGYAALDLSVINQKPPGRTPVRTSVIPLDRKTEIIERIRTWVSEGRQAYWVCTLIEESELLSAQAAESTLQSLKDTLPELRIALVHGRLKPNEKERIMGSFKAAELDLLVATTVIEVGVDVPNAGLMVIENAERLGLSQLHQLRGRVGRGPGTAHCVLIYQPPLGKTAKERLAILRETDDGFLIAEKDLEIRGAGEILGTRQTGELDFRIADLARDGALVEGLKDIAEDMIRKEPQNVERLIHRWLRSNQDFIEA